MEPIEHMKIKKDMKVLELVGKMGKMGFLEEKKEGNPMKKLKLPCPTRRKPVQSKQNLLRCFLQRLYYFDADLTKNKRQTP